MTTAPLELLIVDQDEAARSLVRSLLPASHTVFEADKGITALERASTHRPDCILLNWQLPDIEALDLIQLWSVARIPVIVLTKEPAPQTVAPAMAQGAQDFLLKDQLSTGLLEQTIADAKANA
jgi:two-component system, sensor histidine kinase and response regulator